MSIIVTVEYKEGSIKRDAHTFTVTRDTGAKRYEDLMVIASKKYKVRPCSFNVAGCYGNTLRSRFDPISWECAPFRVCLQVKEFNAIHLRILYTKKYTGCFQEYAKAEWFEDPYSATYGDLSKVIEERHMLKLSELHCFDIPNSRIIAVGDSQKIDWDSGYSIEAICEEVYE